ncbi:SlyX family protein [Ferrimonas marina]|uniref:Protein SlyX homolog n=1 Tax=Ferrimonas marina TaxID=299255 RepID=A0A1M5ZP03_9GAMM|nr:SlyX family protein [Ferrimonas marina]SHI26125.1 SlyX protein [Ferrimonas marina]
MNAEQERLIDLETKVAYQDATIEQLNEMVTQLGHQVAKQAEQIRLLAERVKAMPQAQVADSSEESPPPHY